MLPLAAQEECLFLMVKCCSIFGASNLHLLFCEKASAIVVVQLIISTHWLPRVYKEERNYILNLVKRIKASGCNVLLIQKSILRDATTELSLHYLAKVGSPAG